jgi:heterodisulfide reductase subunit A-like polyferredoxin
MPVESGAPGVFLAGAGVGSRGILETAAWTSGAAAEALQDVKPESPAE